MGWVEMSDKNKGHSGVNRHVAEELFRLRCGRCFGIVFFFEVLALVFI
jgi:hypothetical protein